MATLIGQTLGQYQIVERLGRGGMAEVYKGLHPKLERHAAIKVLHGFLAEGEDFLARFQREAKAIAALSHPNIVQVYDFDVHDDLYYMVIEYIDGGTLKERLIQSAGPLPLSELTRIFCETAAALHYAHQHGVLHRDIKPANVLLDTKGRAVLTDFGIARILSDTQFTVTGALVGTPAYMSPEQGMGLHVSEASDIYALGIILYEMLTGQVPFSADTPFGIIHKHINDPLPPPRTFRDDIPDSLEAVVLKSLEKESADRYQSPAEMVSALELAIATVAGQETIVDVSPPARQNKDPQPEVPESTPDPTIASRATVAMPPEEDIAQKATIVMTAVDEPFETIKSPDTIEPAAVEEPPEAKENKVLKRSPIEPRQKKATPQPKIKPGTIILGVVGLITMIALLIWGIPQLSGSRANCDNVDNCHQLTEELMGNGDFGGALTAVDTAIGLVPDNEHPSYANLWCLRGEILMAEDRIDEAIWSFEDCMAWTEGDPGLEDMRIFASDQIAMLQER
jgi:serine/threonine protein kinase